jgi:hypothetical protein
VKPVALLIAGLLCPSVASAQLGFLDKVFEKVTDVGASAVIGKSIRGGSHITDAADGLSLTGVSFETSIDLGHVYARKPDALCLTNGYQATPTAREETIEGKAREAPGSPKPEAADSGKATKRVTEPADSDKVLETVITYSLEKGEEQRFSFDQEGRKEFDKEHDRDADVAQAQGEARQRVLDDKWKQWKRRCTEAPAVGLELAIGYSQLAGFRGGDINLRGSIEELPALTLYTTFVTGTWFDFYGGLRSGLTQLKGVRVLSGDSIFHGDASTVQFGLVGPALLFGNPGGNWGVFLEPAWTIRKFDTVKWGDGVPPGQVLRGLDFSTFTLAIGGQIEFGDGE